MTRDNHYGPNEKSDISTYRLGFSAFGGLEKGTTSGTLLEIVVCLNIFWMQNHIKSGDVCYKLETFKSAFNADLLKVAISLCISVY